MGNILNIGIARHFNSVIEGLSQEECQQIEQNNLNNNSTDDAGVKMNSKGCLQTSKTSCKAAEGHSCTADTKKNQIHLNQSKEQSSCDKVEVQ